MAVSEARDSSIEGGDTGSTQHSDQACLIPAWSGSKVNRYGSFPRLLGDRKAWISRDFLAYCGWETWMLTSLTQKPVNVSFSVPEGLFT